MEIARSLLVEAVETESIARDEDEQRWSLAFHYAEHTSKLSLTLQQCTQLLEEATSALAMYDELVEKRECSAGVSWFTFGDLQKDIASPARRAWTSSASHTSAPSDCCAHLAPTGCAQGQAARALPRAGGLRGPAAAATRPRRDFA
jgi:hypothetical protein